MPAGTFYFGYEITPNNWQLNKGSGQRVAAFPITFPELFSNPPLVVAALSGLDVDHSANTRVRLQVQNVTATGFELVVITWGDTILYSVWGMWYAEIDE
jgi:hypothetical protein